MVSRGFYHRHFDPQIHLVVKSMPMLIEGKISQGLGIVWSERSSHLYLPACCPELLF